MPEIVDRWNAAYFDRQLSPGVVAELGGLIGASADAQALADRAFRFMRAARFGPADFSVLTAWMLGFSVPRTVPSAWSGMVPPVTMTGRHRKIDEYVAENPWHQPDGEGVFVDLGCGFPPFTTIDTAKRLPDWRVIGVDPTFGRYVVYDADGVYASFDSDHRLLYYQAGTTIPIRRAPGPGSTACWIVCCHNWTAVARSPTSTADCCSIPCAATRTTTSDSCRRASASSLSTVVRT